MMRAHVFTHDPAREGRFTPRIEFDMADQTDVSALAWIGKEINRGEEKVGPLYRNAGFPPLGVGDLIVLDRERWWLCDATGWKSVDKPESVPDEPQISAGEGVYKVKRQGI